MKKLLLFLAVTLIVVLAVPAFAVPAPGWQCLPYGGVAEYEIADTACTGHAPVFVYLGDGQTALAYFMLTLREDEDANCFEGHSGWAPVEFGAQPVRGIGANTLRGEGLSFDALPGAPADQACLDSLRMPWPDVRVTVSRVDEGHLLLTAAPLPAVEK